MIAKSFQADAVLELRKAKKQNGDDQQMLLFHLHQNSMR